MINLVSILINKRFFCLMLLVLYGHLFAQNQNITINSNVNVNNSIDLNYEKILPGSYYIIVNFLDIRNCYTNEYEGVIKGHSGRLLNLKPINPQQGIGYSLKYSAVMGVPNPKVDSLFQYTLPFKIGKKVKIYEAGNLGEKYFGSEKPANWKSYVVHFKNPDSIFSMRKGIVVKLTNEYDDDASTTKIYTSKRNSIIIEHEDGTFAEYKGFKKNSFKVKLGQIVYPQTQLGTIELFNKSENNYRFDFCIYYLFGLSFFDNNDTEKKVTRVYTSNHGSRYKFLTPNFLTSEGATSIESKKEYTGFFNETILLQEMTRSEKKKYLKKPTSFE